METVTIYTELKNYPLLLKVKEVAEILRCDRKTVDNYVRQGLIDSMPMGKGYRIRKPDLIKFINR